MNYAIFLFVYFLLTTVIYFIVRKKDFMFWVKVTLLYLLVFISYNDGYIHIPIGILIGYFIVLKWGKNHRSTMKLTLFFALSAYLFACYVTPPIKIENYTNTKAIHEEIYKFKDIESVKTFSVEEPIQKKLSKNTNKDLDIEHVMFLTYILNDNNIKILNEHWLIYTASHELGIIKSNKSKEGVLIYNYNGIDYLGKFTRDNGNIHLKYVIKGKLNK
ncbi:hypothetical protein SB775_25845 [Peribacillus sp. SIMBA_075]|uniref:hypothetical protein n=1 Tax=Peribacillus sp. SIMBA_075 TaxID=3085813 RepID=UPI003979CE9B